MTIPNGHFFEVLPDGRYHFRFDHHLINDFNTCDRYFMFRHMPSAVVDGTPKVYRPKVGDKFKTSCGSWWSRVMELFYHEMSHLERGIAPGFQLMQKFASDAWQDLDMERFASLPPDDKQRQNFDAFGGATGALQMALEYYQSYALADASAWKIISTEKGFGLRDEVFLGEDDKVIVHYMGKPDMVVYDYASSEIVPLDFKTKDRIQSNVNSLWKPHPQTTGYIVAINDIIDQIQSPTLGVSIKRPTTRCFIRLCARLRPTDKPRNGVRAPRFVTCYPNYSLEELEEWKKTILAKARRLRLAIESNEFIPRESACHLFYNGCDFRRVCSLSPSVRHVALKADFVQVEPWKPYEVDDDD